MSLFNDSQRMGASAAGAYEIERSVRFNSAETAVKLTRTFSGGTTTKWTLSVWVKRTKLGATQPICGYYSADTSNQMPIRFDSSDRIEWYNHTGGYQGRLVTNRVFRDCSSWYHLVFVWDTANSTVTERMRIYVNGIEETSFSTDADPGSGQTSYWNSNNEMTIGTTTNYNDGWFDGYMAEMHFIDNAVKAGGDFGEEDADTGQWIPKKYAGSYGTTGFYLSFKDNSSTANMFVDDSANSNNWSHHNMSNSAGIGNDSFEDTPTNNWCTLNPVDTNVTLTQGNLVSNVSSGFQLARSTIWLTSGKWYWEVICDDTGNGFVGISGQAELLNNRGAMYDSDSFNIRTTNGNKYLGDGNDSSYGSAISDGDVVMVAVDCDAGKAWIGKAGTWFNSGDPAAGSNEGKSGITGAVSPSVSLYDNEDYTMNFGANMSFAHTPPTGFKKINTANLSEPTIKDPTKYFEVMTWSGTDANQNYSLNHTSNIFWGQRRNSDHHWQNFDSIMGDGYAISLNNNYQKYTFGGHAFGTNQISIPYSTSDYYSLSDSGDTYVGYSWKESATSGVDVVEYSGTGSAQNISHSLNAAPQFIIVKRLDSTSNGTAFLRNDRKILINSTTGSNDDANYWNDTDPTSSVFSLGSDTDVNASGGTYRAYCFASVEGFSKIGEYEGNGDNNGVFVYLGFTPAFILIRNIFSTGNWAINDHKRDFNSTWGNDASLYLNLSDDETTSSSLNVDFLSNGFKLRSNNSHYNSNGDTYKYVAFAELPFMYANAR